MMFRRAICLAAVMSLLCAGFVGAAEWRIQRAGIIVIDATPWPDEIAVLVDKWDDVVPLTVRPGACEWRRGTIVLCAGHYGLSGVAGAMVEVRGSRITAAKAAFNLDYSAISEPEPFRGWLLCHEFGHTLGLSHDDVSFTAPNAAYHHGCMNTVWQGEANPSPFDLDTLRALYG